MRFVATPVDGALLVEAAMQTDDRGGFGRLFDEQAFAEAGLPTRYPQHNLSTNTRPGTVRGLHVQLAPHQEAKVVRCMQGALYDVAADTRVGSPTFGRWTSTVLRAGDGRALYVPPGCAHGFQTLEADTHVLYLMDSVYVAESAAGYRYDDPTLAIRWPMEVSVLSAKDGDLPYLPT